MKIIRRYLNEITVELPWEGLQPGPRDEPFALLHQMEEVR